MKVPPSSCEHPQLTKMTDQKTGSQPLQQPAGPTDPDRMRDPDYVVRGYKAALHRRSASHPAKTPSRNPVGTRCANLVFPLKKTLKRTGIVSGTGSFSEASRTWRRVRGRASCRRR